MRWGGLCTALAPEAASHKNAAKRNVFMSGNLPVVPDDFKSNDRIKNAPKKRALPAAGT
jgi:hypothetical protein